MSDAARGRSLVARRLRAGGPPEGESLRLQRYGRGWRQALHTARRFVHEFGAARVVVVGDILHPDRFPCDGGIELVVWGMRADVFWYAVACVHEEIIPARIHDGDHLDARVSALVQSEAIELARRGPE